MVRKLRATTLFLKMCLQLVGGKADKKPYKNFWLGKVRLMGGGGWCGTWCNGMVAGRCEKVLDACIYRNKFKHIRRHTHYKYMWKCVQMRLDWGTHKNINIYLYAHVYGLANGNNIQFHGGCMVCYVAHYSYGGRIDR